jgi:sugar lactone lactonase YvrE
VWFEAAEESLVTSMVADGQGGVLFGVSPEGTVMHARREKGEVQLETVVETGALFIWSLVRASDGTMWIGTGAPGAVMRVAAGEDPVTVFDSGDDPVRTLATLPGGGVVVGTGGRGRVIRVSEDERAFVLLDAEETEIVSVVAADDGTIYAVGTKSAKQPSARPKTAGAAAAATAGAAHVVVTANGDDGQDTNGSRESKAPPASSQASQAFKSQPGGALYRIDPDGTPRKLWETSSEMPFGVLTDTQGALLIGTGDGGRIHTLDREGRSSKLLRIPSNQVSALAGDGSGRIWLGGTTDARVEILGPGPRDEGSYLSPAVDAGSLADWGRLLWDAEVPRGSGLRVQARSGNTAEPDDTWSPWTDLETGDNTSVAETRLPAARWFQARFDFAGGSGDSPRLRRIEIAFQPRNRPPEVAKMTVEAPGVVWMRGPKQSSFRVGPAVADDPVARGVADSLMRGGRTVRARGTIRRTYEAGARTFSWEALDPDGDRLRYALAIKEESVGEWFPLARELDEQFHSWDARAMPDGIYRVRLTVDDSLDNPNGTHRRSERVSDAFRVDNTRPSVGEFEVDRTSNGHEVRFVARDPGGSIAALEVAIDGRGWMPLSPLDGVADSELEDYTLIVEPDPSSRTDGRSMIVRVTDSSGNLGGAMWRID